MGLLTVHGSTKFLILVLMFLKYVIFCVYPWRDLLWYKFFHFQDIVWLVKSFWCVHCCSIHQFYWVSDRCRSEFVLWWFFVRKNLSSKYWQFFFLFGRDYQTFLVSIKLKDRAVFLGLIMHFFTCLCYLGVLNNCFQFFLWSHVFLCAYQWCGFSR